MRKIILLLLLCLGSCYAKAQNEAYKQYINTYKGMAIEQMRRYGIPASITLAQGLLESGAGTSFLAIILVSRQVELGTERLSLKMMTKEENVLGNMRILNRVTRIILCF